MTAPKAGWQRIAVIGADGKLKAPEPEHKGWIAFAIEPRLDAHGDVFSFDFEAQHKQVISAFGLSAELLAELEAHGRLPVMVNFERPKQRSLIHQNASKDPNYSPYCGRCSGLHRMTKVEPFYWRHHCGAEHDERG